MNQQFMFPEQVKWSEYEQSAYEITGGVCL